jgi:hypothetical protein
MWRDALPVWGMEQEAMTADTPKQALKIEVAKAFSLTTRLKTTREHGKNIQ